MMEKKEKEYLLMDPYVLLSLVNTKLRNDYHSLESLCDDLGFDPQELILKMKSIGYAYNVEMRQFKLLSN